MIKAIQTTYCGYKMRSRTEARWAVFFDALGVPWEYEKEGFELEDGTWYLPDFWLPTQNLWVEVKGGEPTHDEKMKCHLLADGTSHPVLLVRGAPGYVKCEDGLMWPTFCPIVFWGWMVPRDPLDWIGAWAAQSNMEDGNYPPFPGHPRFPYGQQCQEDVLDFADGHFRMVPLGGSKPLERAANKARAARFEHGASG